MSTALASSQIVREPKAVTPRGRPRKFAPGSRAAFTTMWDVKLMAAIDRVAKARGLTRNTFLEQVALTDPDVQEVLARRGPGRPRKSEQGN